MVAKDVIILINVYIANSASSCLIINVCHAQIPQ